MMPQAAAINPTARGAGHALPALALVAGVPQAEPLRSRFNLGTWATGSAQARLGCLASLHAARRSETGPSLSPASMGASAPRLATSCANGKESAECLASGVDSGPQAWARGRHGSFLAVQKPTAAHHRIIPSSKGCKISIAVVLHHPSDLLLIVSALSLAAALAFLLLGD